MLGTEEIRFLVFLLNISETNISLNAQYSIFNAETQDLTASHLMIYFW